ncbi:MAG: HNH endonuclease signature motif containing protein, partial [Nanoarchaeota archaeon]|nr:HNH endonuclease signature motif containing protein [Nanoarchaeota archaeon]
RKYKQVRRNHYNYLQRKYRKTEKGRELFKKHELLRYRRTKNIINHFTYGEWKEKVENTKGVCPNCKVEVSLSKLTLDHIYPIAKADEDFKRNGIKRVYSINDIQPLCLSCNSKNGKK